jgi:predicted Zn-dependent peptidase
VRHAAGADAPRRGGRSRAELDATLDELGASIDVVVGADSVGFMASGLSRHLPACRAARTDVLARPTFDDGEHERCAARAWRSLDDVRDGRRQPGSRYWDRAAFGGHPYGRTVLGTEASLARLDLADARAWWKTRIVAATAASASPAT